MGQIQKIQGQTSDETIFKPGGVVRDWEFDY